MSGLIDGLADTDEMMEENQNIEEMAAILEAVLFVAGDPVARDTLQQGLEWTADALETAVVALEERYASGGLQLMQLENRLQIVTRPKWGKYVEDVLRPARKQTLSQTVLETLIIVAYRQPVTRGEIEAVRGVKSDYSLSVLLQRGFVKEVGKKDAIGRPALFGTTENFLRHFGLSGLEQLPPLEQGLGELAEE